jgi:undecaprenyl-diphosphatase
MSSGMARSQNTDIDLLKKINLGRNFGLDPFMSATSKSVYPIAVAIPVAEMVVGLATKNKELQHTAIQSVAASGLNFIVAFGLKEAVNRTRPYDQWPEINTYGPRETDASFPSGHTSFAFNTATSVALAYPKWYVIAPTCTWAVLVGYSRMHMGMHYPSDVLAGALIGTGTSWLAWKGNQYLQRRHKTKGDRH